MSFFQKLFSIFTAKKKREDEWAKNFSNIPPANPKNLLPLDSGNSSMT